MAYAHCVPARIATLNHSLNNLVSGSLEIEGRVLTFSTRKHIVQATNRLYKSNPWKPRRGSAVLIDGDLGATHLIVDHIEMDHQTDVPSEHAELDRLAAQLPSMPIATKTLRHWKPGDRRDGRWRVRWTNLVTAGRDLDLVERGAVMHGLWDGLFQEWRLWLVDADSGRRVHEGLHPAALRVLRDEAVPSTPKPAHAEDNVPAPRFAPASEPPYDDCPF